LTFQHEFELVIILRRGRRNLGGPVASNRKKGPLGSAVAVMSVGIEMAIAITVGYFIGNWIDGKLDTAPWFLLLFLALGSAAAFRGLWRTARKYWAGDDEGPGSV